MSPNKENELNKKNNKLKKRLKNLVATGLDKDSKVRKGLFRKGLCTSHLKRAEGPVAEKFARLKGDLNKIIGFGKNNSSSPDTDHFLPNARRSEIPLNEPSPHNAHHQKSQSLLKEQFNTGPREKSTSPVQRNKSIHGHNLENFSSVTDVKRARTAEFVNSLPTVNDEENVLTAESCKENSTLQGDEEYITAHMQSCFNEHVSSLSYAIVDVKENRFAHIDYNQSLKNALVREFNEFSECSSGSTNFSGSKSVTPKSLDYKEPGLKCPKNVHFSPSLFSPEGVSPQKYSSSKLLSSPQMPSPPLFGSPPDLRCTDPMPDSDGILHSSDFLPSYPCYKIPDQNQTFRPLHSLSGHPSSTHLNLAAPNNLYHPTMPQHHHYSHLYDVNLETSSDFVPPKGNVVHQKMPQISDPSHFQSSSLPDFKFYPRNMF